MEGCNALQVLETHQYKAFYPENNGREGLYVNVAAVFIKFLGDKAWVLRLPSAIFGVLTLVGVYLLGKELVSRECGLLAAFFNAASFWHLVFSRIAFRAILAPCFLVFAVWLLLRGVKKMLRGERWFGPLLLAGVIYGLGFYTYIPYRVTPALIASILIYYGFLARRKDGLKPYSRSVVTFAAATLLTVLPLARAFLTIPSFDARVTQLSVFRYPHPLHMLTANVIKTAAMMFVHGDWNLRHNVPTRPEVFWPVAILVAIGGLLGCVTLYTCFRDQMDSGNWFAPMVLLSWIVFGTIPVIFSAEAVPHALRSILLIPPVFLLASIAGLRTYQFLSARLPSEVVKALAWVFLAIVAYEPYQTYFKTWAQLPELSYMFNGNMAAISERINALPKKKPKLVVAMGGDHPKMENGIPSGLMTIAFLTGSYTENGRKDRNIFYTAHAPLKHLGDCQQLEPPLQDTEVFCVFWREPRQN